MIDSMFKFVLNLPTAIYSLFVVDITRCYKRIPLTREDNLPNALAYITKKAFQHRRSKSKTQSIWVHINILSGIADKARWSQRVSDKTCWVEITQTRFSQLHNWLIDHCFIQLGDEIWRQQMGIPMGFSCSPLWCNLYFLTYEIRFMLRLASLNQYDLMQHFKSCFWYIDDLCILNNEVIHLFLQPEAIRTDLNPLWIYSLGVVEIKTELDMHKPDRPFCGIKGHFLNVQLERVNTETGEFITTKFDKRRSLPFRFQQYIQLKSIQLKSNQSIQHAYNITISQMMPILCMASSHVLAIHELNILAQTLHNNGFATPRIYRLMLQFCSNQTLPGLRFDITKLVPLLENLAFAPVQQIPPDTM